MSQKWVLVVDDDPTIQSVFKAALEGQGYATAECGDGHEAFEFVRTVVPDLVILNLRMEKAPGGLFLDDLRASDSRILWQMPVLIVSGYLGEEHGHDEGLNVIGRLEKPVTLDTLVGTVRAAIGAGTDPDRRGARQAQ